MDGISAATAVFALAQTTFQVYTLCQEYYFGVKNARKDIQGLCDESMSLRNILTLVSDLTEEDDSASLSCIRLLTQDGGPLQQCKKLFEELAAKLNPGDGKTLMRQFGMRALKWPFNNKDVEVLLQKIGKHKATFNMALATDIVGLSRSIKEGVSTLNDSLAEMRIEQRSFKSDARWKSIYQWLSPPDPSSNHNTACSEHQPTTGAWFLDSEVFMKWKMSSNSFLWLYGIPGCGKTILSSSIIEDVTESSKTDPSIAIVYFYFDFHTTEKQQCKNFLRSLIVQLSMQSAITPQSLDSLFSRNLDGLKEPAVNALMHTLQQILGDFQQVFVVIDALDECEDREELLGLLEAIFNWQLENLHILATSRRERDIEESLEPLVTDQISIHGTPVNSDIQTYISERLKKDPKLRKWPTNVKAEIESTLMSKADGMFRWVVCQLDSLRKHLKPGLLRKALKSLPTDLNETYDRILEGIDKEYIEDAFKILQWLVHSTRPLDLAEVAEVVAVGLDNEPEFDPESRLGDPFDVLTICSSLVTTVTRGNSDDGHIYRKPEIRLAHFSVKEYLATACIRREDKTYAIEKEDQRFVAQSCLTYLLHLTEPVMLTSSYVDDFPLAEYAANYWFIHAKAAKKDIDKINELGFRLCQSRGTYVNWIRLRDLDGYELGDHELCNRDINRFDDHEKIFASPLYYASLAGLVDLSRYLLEKGADVNAEGGMYGYALQAASVVAYPSVVKLLLEHGAAIDARGGKHHTALHAACYKGHGDIVRLLLDHGANTAIENMMHNTALQVAHNEKEEAIITIIHEMRPRLRHDLMAPQLREASLKGQLMVVGKLVEDGADINGEGGEYKSALQAASCNGHERIVKLLLENGADVNVWGGKYGSALQAASNNGHDLVVKLLLANGANVNLRGGKYDSALQAACINGHETVVNLLLENGADIAPSGRGRDHFCALQAASYYGSESIVRLLLKKGADVNFQGGDNDTPLQAACVQGNVAVIKLLLENGADIEARGGEAGNPLIAAACMGREEVVKLLLENGADLNARVPQALYHTALAGAAFQGSEAVVMLLLERGIDIKYCPEAIMSVGDGAMVLPFGLHESAWCNIVKLMHKNGARFTEKVFTRICNSGSEAVVKLMFEIGLDFVPDVDYYVKTSADVAKERVYRLILTNGANGAGKKGYQAIIKLLQEKISSLSG